MQLTYQMCSITRLGAEVIGMSQRCIPNSGEFGPVYLATYPDRSIVLMT